MSTLNDQLLAAHQSGDRDALITGYTRAADSAPDIDAACFYLTHAFIFALEFGDPRASDLRDRLAHHARV